MNVVVLGCGPSGLIAAHAAADVFGANVSVVSVKRKSPLYGCQYLHQEIPGLGLDNDYREVHYELFGTEEGYRQKVYGSLRVPVSPSKFNMPHRAWDLRTAYDRLWTLYEDIIVDSRLTPETVSLISESVGADVVLSTIPAKVLCQVGERHTFQSVGCWALGDAPELGQSVPISCEPFKVHCDGTDNVGWYRISNVWGRSTVEWPGHRRRPPLDGVVRFEKPLATDCDCLPHIQRLGRYGRWEKSVLVHQVYYDTINTLMARV